MNFNPRMVTLAREAVGLTQTSLANSAGISQGLISKIENGFEIPQASVWETMADACGVPFEFFAQEDEVIGEGMVDFYHKKRLTLPMKPLKYANAQANMHRLEARRLLRTLEFSSLAPFPVSQAEDSWSPEFGAQMVRATWRIPNGPLPDLIALIEATGVPVYTVNLGHEKLSAVSIPGMYGRHVIVLNDMLPPSAQRFALAHELGHLVLHTGSLTPEIEAEADRFASSLLMPAEDIRHELSGLRFRELGTLKSRWRVSLAALIRRAHDLGKITDRQYRTFNIQLNSLPGGRKNEPGEFEPEKPRLMRHVVEHYINELAYSRDDVAKLIVVLPSKLASCYLGEPQRNLHAVVNRKLHSVPMLPM